MRYRPAYIRLINRRKASPAFTKFYADLVGLG